MKRSLSLILAMMMVLSCFVVGATVTASAETPEGTGINDLSALEGSSETFYLTENVNLDASIASFSGTLDGNGMTVTVSVPMFSALSGATIKNLTIAGTISYTGVAKWGGCGALVCNVGGNLTLENVVNTASVTMTPSAGHDGVAGLIGVVTTGSVSLTGCSNSGAITGNASGSNQIASGGLVGYIVGSGTLTVTDCSNSGTITSSSTGNNMMGGLVGWNSRSGVCTFTDSSNSGSIVTSQGGKTGGILGVAGGASNHIWTGCTNTGTLTVKALLVCCSGGFIGDEAGFLSMTNCTNSGDIEFQSGGTNTIYPAGFVGRCTTSSTSVTLTFDSCINRGNINAITSKNTNLTGGFVGYSQATAPYQFTDCCNEGNLTESSLTAVGGRKGGGFIGVLEKSTAGFTDCVNKGNVQIATLAGGFIGDDRQSTTYERCINTGTIAAVCTLSGNAYAAGFVGQLYDNSATVTMQKCANYGSVTAGSQTTTSEYAGGFVGKTSNTGSSWTDVANYGTITATQNAGGIAASSGTGTFTRCANFGNLLNATNKDPLNADASAKASSTITDCYGGTEESSTYRGAGAGAVMPGLNFGGGTWIVREGYPELAFVETVLGSKDATENPTVTFKGFQTRTPEGGTFAIRAVESVLVPDPENNNPFQYVGMEVYFVKTGDSSVKTADCYSRYYYTSILAGSNENGVTTAWGGNTDTDPAYVDGTYYSALTVTEIPSDGTYTFVVIPYTTAADGEHEKSYGDAYAILFTDGVYVDHYHYAAPARTN